MHPSMSLTRMATTERMASLCDLRHFVPFDSQKSQRGTKCILSIEKKDENCSLMVSHKRYYFVHCVATGVKRFSKMPFVVHLKK